MLYGVGEGGTGLAKTMVAVVSPATALSFLAVTKLFILHAHVDTEYYLQKGSMTFLQVGKIETYGQGCDGPLEKVVRDFMVEGDAVNLIDMKAGIEHFGRKIPDRMDVILGVLDYTLESISIAKRMAAFCQDAGIRNFWLILNKIVSEEIESMILAKLLDLQHRVLGSISYDQELIKIGLSGNALEECRALDEMVAIVDSLEQVVSKSHFSEDR
jgi:CO dehydrogenase nickel-insertion accessory protein CooC1